MNEQIDTKNSEQRHSNARTRSTVYELFILVLTVFSLVVVALILLWPEDGAEKVVLLRVDFLISVIFLIDFLLNLWRSQRRVDYFFKKGGWLDLLGSIPAVPELPWTALFRLARLNRFVRIGRRLRRKDRDEVIGEALDTPARTLLLTVIFSAIAIITAASLFILRIERGAPGVTIETGTDAFWWAFVTMTTVGYGDYVPVTFPGRVAAMILMVFGIGLFAVLTSFVARRLVALQDKGEDLVAIVTEQNAIIRAELAEIKELLKQQESVDQDEQP